MLFDLLLACGLSIVVVFQKETISLILTAEQIVILFISAITLVFRESILTFSYIGRIQSALENAKKSSDYKEHSSIKSLGYEESIKTSSFVDLLAETSEDLNTYKKQTEKYKRAFNIFYMIVMCEVLLTTALYTTNYFHPDNFLPKFLYVAQYLTVLIWAFGVLLIERQKNKILRSLEQSNILAKYKTKIEEVHNQSKGLNEEISLLDKHLTPPHITKHII